MILMIPTARATTSLLAFAIAASASAGVPVYPFHAAVAASNPMLWYRFDEPAGSTTIVNHGSLGAAFNGTTFNGVSLGPGGIVGDGIASFNNTLQQYVESLAAAPISMTGNPTFTAEAIVRVNAGDANMSNFGYPPMLHWGAPFTGESVYFSLFRFTENRYYAGFYNGGLRTVGTMPQNCFLHIVWVRDSAGGTAGQYAGTTLYINGVAVPMEPDNTLPGAPVINVTSTTFRVQKATDGTRYFAGAIDEVVLYDHVLTESEVLAHFAALDLPPLDCRSDLNRDGVVNGADLGLLLGAWDSMADCGEPASADLNCDCIVDGADLGLMLGAWGPCS
ncbi:MAG: LamG-like jellyroll fold domain-containing protein [Phycisphaerales bacterium]